MAERKDSPLRNLRRDAASGCLLWQGKTSSDGYGLLVRGGRTHMAHRYMYEREVGQIPEGMHLDHLCRVRACVEPAHLEPVTPRENAVRAATYYPGGRNVYQTDGGRWYAQIRLDGEFFYLGVFDEREVAEQAIRDLLTTKAPTSPRAAELVKRVRA